MDEKAKFSKKKSVILCIHLHTYQMQVDQRPHMIKYYLSWR